LTPEVTVVDYGVGNLLSVRSAFEYNGASIKFSSDPEEIAKSDRLLLPGVGAFIVSMDDMENASLIEPVREFSRSGKPLLGICLGSQMLFSNSSEHGQRDGLNLVAGNVVDIPKAGTDGISHRIPHVGWNELRVCGKNWEGTILEGLEPGASVYFAHSYMSRPENAILKIADCDYNGINILATIQDENIHGCQFHPEKSGTVGLKVIENYLKM
jgi:imidazole glycerol-phosphate synthase subunit HisH